MLEIRGEDYTSYSAVLLHALQKSRSKAECLCSKERSSVIWHKFDYLINSIRGVVLVVIAGVLVLSGKRSVETSRADTLEKIKFSLLILNWRPLIFTCKLLFLLLLFFGFHLASWVVFLLVFFTVLSVSFDFAIFVLICFLWCISVAAQCSSKSE